MTEENFETNFKIEFPPWRRHFGKNVINKSCSFLNFRIELNRVGQGRQHIEFVSKFVGKQLILRVRFLFYSCVFCSVRLAFLLSMSPFPFLACVRFIKCSGQVVGSWSKPFLDCNGPFRLLLAVTFSVVPLPYSSRAFHSFPPTSCRVRVWSGDVADRCGPLEIVMCRLPHGYERFADGFAEGFGDVAALSNLVWSEFLKS